MSARALHRPLAPAAASNGAARWCTACANSGAIETETGPDACPLCMHGAELEWLEQQHTRRESMWTEHVNRDGRGADPSAVALSAFAGKLELTLGRGALELLPWFRGGERVSVLMGQGAEAGRMRVVRGDTHVLLAQVGSAARARLEKLPPVVLRMDAPAHMAGDVEHEPEAVAHRIDKGLLEVVLPGWAAPPVPAVAPRTQFQGGFFYHEDRDRPAALAGAGR